MVEKIFFYIIGFGWYTLGVIHDTMVTHSKVLGTDEPCLMTPLDQKLYLWFKSYSDVILLVVPPRGTYMTHIAHLRTKPYYLLDLLLYQIWCQSDRNCDH